MAKKMGRPPIQINKEEFEKLCALQCTEEEIAGFFDCTIDTICNWCKKTYNMTFLEIYKSKSAMGKISLRRSQFKLAQKSASMAIFLGKNYLGQKDTFPEDIGKEVINNAITNIATLINNPKKVRTEEDLENE